MTLSEAQDRISPTNWACNPADLLVMKVFVVGKDGQVGIMKIIIGLYGFETGPCHLQLL